MIFALLISVESATPPKAHALVILHISEILVKTRIALNLVFMEHAFIKMALAIVMTVGLERLATLGGKLVLLHRPTSVQETETVITFMEIAVV